MLDEVDVKRSRERRSQRRPTANRIVRAPACAVKEYESRRIPWAEVLVVHVQVVYASMRHPLDPTGTAAEGVETYPHATTFADCSVCLLSAVERLMMAAAG